MEEKVLTGYRRELTKELFEDLGSLQCEPEEILGYIGTTLPKLKAWCRKVYHRPLEEILEAVRQDGLIQIRRASFDQLKKSATMMCGTDPGKALSSWLRKCSGGGSEKIF